MNRVSWRDVREADLRLDDVESALGIVANQIGDEDWAICPLPEHGGDRSDAHFSINRETYTWHCFTCGGGGALPLLVQKCLDLDRTNAINWLAQYSDVSTDAPIENWKRKFKNIAARSHTETFRRPSTLPWMPDRLIEGYRLAYLNDPAPRQWVLDKWGIWYDTACSFDLGYARNYNWKDKLRGEAIIIPHWWNDKLVGWQARWMEDLKPKYVNTDDFPKQYSLYNWDRVKYSRAPLLVVESFATVMKLHQCRYPAVATFGATISREQENVLASYQGPLLLAYDNDVAGQSAQKKLAESLSSRANVRIVPPPEGEKADMGDLDGLEIEALIERAKPYFLAKTSL